MIEWIIDKTAYGVALLITFFLRILLMPFRFMSKVNSYIEEIMIEKYDF